MTSRLPSFLRKDVFGDAIDPEQRYEVRLHSRGLTSQRQHMECVSGEDILAAAAWLDELLKDQRDADEMVQGEIPDDD